MMLFARYIMQSQNWHVWHIVSYRLKNKSEGKGKPDLNILYIYNMPFRGLAKMTG